MDFGPQIRAVALTAGLWLLAGSPTPKSALAFQSPAQNSGVDDDTTETALSFKVAASKIESILNLELTDRRTIQDWISGTFIRGTTLTNAKTSLRVVPSDDSAAIDLVIESETTSDSVGYNQATRTVGVNVSFSTFTQAKTHKRIYLTNHGILVAPAQTWASTSMNINNVEIFAGGLFKRLKRRMTAKAAWHRLMQEKSNQEQQISWRVATELSAMTDEKANAALVPANSIYRKYFLNGFYKKGRLPGKFLLQTSTDALTVSVLAPIDSITTANPRMASEKRGRISAHVNVAILDHIAESLLSGVELQSGEIEEMISFASQTGQVISRDDTWKLKLREKNPVEFKFDDGSITMRIVVTTLTPKSAPAETGGIIEVRFVVTKESNESIRIRRDGLVSTLPIPPYAHPSSQLTHAIDHHFNRGEPGIDRRFVFGRFPGPMSNLGSLDVSALLLDQGWLLFEADLHHMDQNSLNVTEDEN